jgi:hypothetical protein
MSLPARAEVVIVGGGIIAVERFSTRSLRPEHNVV